MLGKTRQIGIILCALILVMSLFVFTGCGKKDDALKGRTVVIGNWWSNWNTDTFEPRDEGEQRTLEWRKKIQAENSFTMYEEEICGWDDYLQTVTNFILSGNKNYSAYYIGADWAMSLFKQGLLAPIPTKDVKVSGQPRIAGKQTPYNGLIASLFNFNGGQYALAIGEGNDSWQSILILFNKRLLREAGVDPELPYDLQKAGTWTWDAYLDILRKTTRDIDNDGRIDVYGTAGDDNSDDISATIYSNNANYITFDSNGKAVNATTRPEFIEALQFYNQLQNEGLIMPKPEGAGWAWNFYNFVDGKVAFFVGQEWFKGMAGDMQDDYGSVVMPKGPKATGYRTSVTDNVMIIPNLYTSEELDAIVKGIDLWNVPDSDDILDGHAWAYRDRRAVDETIALTKDSSQTTYRNYMLVPGANDVVGSFGEEIRTTRGNPAQLIEQYAPNFNAVIDAFNR